MSLELLFLGTGTSAGVPMIGCECAVCRSDDPRDRRTRPSVVVAHDDPAEPHTGKRRWLIDTAPELRGQILRHGFHRIDGVLFTHNHADHLFGLDDLRRFNAVMGEPLDLYAEAATLAALKRTFRYIFEPEHNVNSSFVPSLRPSRLERDEPLDLLGTRFTPLRLMHGDLPVLGFRMDRDGASIAYCTDVSTIPAESKAQLAGLDVLVIDALRYRPHPTHLTVEQALDVIDELRPRAAYLTHIAHDIRHADLAARLPSHVHVAHDGLRVAARADRPQDVAIS